MRRLRYNRRPVQATLTFVHMTASSTSAFTPQAKDTLEEELIGDELFLCDHSGDKAIHCLNSGAAMIWYLCDGTRTIETIAAEIAAISELSKEQALADVKDTIAKFQELGLLKA